MPGSAPLRELATLPSATGSRPTLGRPGFRPHTIAIVPKTPTAYSSTYGRRASHAEMEGSVAEAARFEESGGSVTVLGKGTESPARMREAFRAAAERGDTDVFVIGHSVAAPNGGRDVVMPDGSKVGESELMEWAAAEGLGCRVVTCYGRRVGFDRPIQLNKARLLVENATRVIEVTARGEGTARPAGEGGTRPLSLDDWDKQFSESRNAAAASDVALIGATRRSTGETLIWESLRARPSWPAWVGGVIALTGVAANVLVMWRVQPQVVGGFQSLTSAADYIRDAFTADRRTRRWTAGLALVALGVVLGSIGLIVWERAFAHSQDTDFAVSWANALTASGAGLVTLAALVCRLAPSASALGRVCRVTAGGVAGGGLIFAILAACFAIPLGLAWVYCVSTGSRFDLVPVRLGAIGVVGVSLLYGGSTGLRAAAAGLPIVVALVYGVSQLAVRIDSTRIALPHKPLNPTVESAGRFLRVVGWGLTLWFVFWVGAALIASGFGMFALFVWNSQATYEQLEKAGLWSAVWIAGPVAAIGAISILVTEHRDQQITGDQSNDENKGAQAPSPQDPAPRTAELGSSGELSNRVYQILFFGVLIGCLFALDVPGVKPYHEGSRVVLIQHAEDVAHAESDVVREAKRSLELLDEFKNGERARLASPPLVPVFEAEVRLAQPAQMLTPLREQKDYEWRYRGPSGVVFTSAGGGEDGTVSGSVVAESHAFVLADDQGGRADRAVLVRLVRDPALGPDPGAVVVVRARNLRLASPTDAWPLAGRDR